MVTCGTSSINRLLDVPVPFYTSRNHPEAIESTQRLIAQVPCRPHTRTSKRSAFRPSFCNFCGSSKVAALDGSSSRGGARNRQLNDPPRLDRCDRPASVSRADVLGFLSGGRTLCGRVLSVLSRVRLAARRPDTGNAREYARHGMDLRAVLCSDRRGELGVPLCHTDCLLHIDCRVPDLGRLAPGHNDSVERL